MGFFNSRARKFIELTGTGCYIIQVKGNFKTFQKLLDFIVPVLVPGGGLLKSAC